jgi:serine/threonine-protein kinase
LDDATIAELVAKTLGVGDARIEDHLDRCERCRRLVSDVARVTPAAEGAPRERLLGARYRVDGLLGRGGMGDVLLAYDQQLDRRVALKVLRFGKHTNDAAARERLQREAQAMARVSHPNVVAVHDLGLDGDHVFVAMELVDGATIARWAREPGRTQRELLDACVQAGRGLAAVHASGLIHRDFTPGNVLVRKDGRVQVADFGLVRIASEVDGVDEPLPGDALPSDAPLDALTRTGEFLGTPAYAAPEVFAGAPADELADQWSFAATVWELIAGEPPFRADSFSALARAVADRQLVEPSRPLPSPVRRVLERSLSVDRARRYGSIAAAVDDLARASSRGWRRRRAAATAIGAVAIAGIAIAALPSSAATGEPCELDTAHTWSIGDRARWLGAVAHVKAASFGELTTTLDEKWARWRGAAGATCTLGLPTDCLGSVRRVLSAVADQAASAKNGMHLAIALQTAMDPVSCIVKPPRPRPALSGAALRAHEQIVGEIDETFVWIQLGRYAEARDRLAKLLARVPEGDLMLRGDVLVRLGEAMGRAGDLAGALPMLQEALAIAERTGDDVARGDAIVMLLSTYEDLGKLREATALATFAAAAEQRMTGDPARASRLENLLGSIAYDDGRYADAERAYRRFVALEEQRYGPRAPAVAGALHNLGMAVHAGGHRDEAIAIEERSLAMFEATVGPDHPDTAMPLTELGALEYERDHADRAAELFSRAIAIRERALGPEHVYLTEPLMQLGHTEVDRGNRARALELYQRALAIAERNVGADHPLTATCEFFIADLLDASNRRAEALAMVERAVTAFDKNGYPMPNLIARGSCSLAIAGMRGIMPPRALSPFLPTRASRRLPPRTRSRRRGSKSG